MEIDISAKRIALSMKSDPLVMEDRNLLIRRSQVWITFQREKQIPA